MGLKGSFPLFPHSSRQSQATWGTPIRRAHLPTSYPANRVPSPPSGYDFEGTAVEETTEVLREKQAQDAPVR